MIKKKSVRNNSLFFSNPQIYYNIICHRNNDGYENEMNAMGFNGFI